MDQSRKDVLLQTALVTVGVAVCSGIMLGVYGLLGYFDLKVLLSAGIGTALTVLNFFAMAVIATLAADKVQDDNGKTSKAILSGTMMLRLLVVFGAAFVLLKSNVCSPLPLLLPMLFVRPVLMLGEFFRKKEGQNK